MLRVSGAHHGAICAIVNAPPGFQICRIRRAPLDGCATTCTDNSEQVRSAGVLEQYFTSDADSRSVPILISGADDGTLTVWVVVAMGGVGSGTHEGQSLHSESSSGRAAVEIVPLASYRASDLLQQRALSVHDGNSGTQVRAVDCGVSCLVVDPASASLTVYVGLSGMPAVVALNMETGSVVARFNVPSKAANSGLGPQLNATNDEEARNRALSRGVTSIAIHPTLPLLFVAISATPTEEGTISTFDTSTGRRIHYFDGRANVSPNCVAVDPSGTFLATAEDDGVVSAWSIKQRSLLWRAPSGASALCAAFHSSQDALIAVARNDGTCTVWTHTVLQPM